MSLLQAVAKLSNPLHTDDDLAAAEDAVFALLNVDVRIAITNFVAMLRRRQLFGSHSVSEKMLDILRMLVSSGKWKTVQDLFALIKLVGRKCQLAQPVELCIANTVRRVLFVLREECAAIVALNNPEFNANPAHDETAKLQHLSFFEEQVRDRISTRDYDSIKPVIAKPHFLRAVNELITDMRRLRDSISAQCLNFIHSNEIILTYGCSNTLVSFFRRASKKRAFQLIIAESAPHHRASEHPLVVALSGLKNIETTLIPDSAICAVMSRVNKVILATHAVLANGALLAICGSANIAVAAKHYAIPVVVLAALFKLSPFHMPFDDRLTPSGALSKSQLMLLSPAPIAEYADDSLSNMHTINPLYDYVSPDLLSLFITDDGAYAPSYMYRLLTESYHSGDDDLDSLLFSEKIPSCTKVPFSGGRTYSWLTKTR